MARAATVFTSRALGRRDHQVAPAITASSPTATTISQKRERAFGLLPRSMRKSSSVGFGGSMCDAQTGNRGSDLVLFELIDGDVRMSGIGNDAPVDAIHEQIHFFKEGL